MKQSNGAITPNSETSTPSKLVYLPPERQINRMEIEAALLDAIAMLDLLPVKLIDEARGGDITFNPPGDLCAIHLAASGVAKRLEQAFDRFDSEVRKLQFLLPTNISNSEN